jgi:hypothetical protein
MQMQFILKFHLEFPVFERWTTLVLQGKQVLRDQYHLSHVQTQMQNQPVSF